MKNIVCILLIAMCCVPNLFAQQQEQRKQNVKPELRKGNELYKQKKYKEAQTSYMSALQKDPTSYTGLFNVGDALYKDKNYENARQAMAASAKSSTDKKEQAKSYHNIGNTFMEEKKWEEAVNAYKQSLRLDPTDADTKYNLAYANAMLKKDGGGGKDKNKNDKKDQDKKDKDKKDQDKKDQDKKDQDKKDQDKKDQDKKDGDPKDDKDKGDKDKKDEQRPQGQPSKLTQQQAENLLNALRQEEKKLQDKKEKAKGIPVKMEKDW
jgi:Ca-activated chloride channel family protein